MTESAICSASLLLPLPLPSPKLRSSCPARDGLTGSYLAIWGRGGGGVCEYMCHRMLHPANAVNAQRALATKVPKEAFLFFLLGKATLWF